MATLYFAEAVQLPLSTLANELFLSPFFLSSVPFSFDSNVGNAAAQLNWCNGFALHTEEGGGERVGEGRYKSGCKLVSIFSSPLHFLGQNLLHSVIQIYENTLVHALLNLFLPPISVSLSSISFP
jgi:hypothetical protein